MSTVVVADKTPIVANGQSAAISAGAESDPTEDALKKPAAPKGGSTQQDVGMPDHNNNNNNDKNNANLAPLARLETLESSTTSFTTSSPSTTNKILNSHTQQPSDKMAVATESFGSRKDTLVARSNSTAARFKEKRRPEPLKLNPNINQEIPLDLSVKSAGNVPSGIRGCIFNLPNASQMATLETPRIQWQDNETFLSLSKSRLFSSSTNAGQRARMSIEGSPPITPSTPLMDLITSPSRAASLRSTNQNASVSTSYEAQNSTSQMICSPLELNKFQILDKITRANKTLLRYHQLKSEIRGAPRRSCSTDNLEYLCTKVMQIQANQNHLNLRKETSLSNQHQDQDSVMNRSSNLNQPHINDHLTGKKNAISPLATKSLSSTTANSETGRFSYGNQHTLTFVSNEDQKSPRTNKVVTPTSVANATANLSNIHLSSPTRKHDSSPPSGLICDTPNSNLDQQVSFHHNSSFSSLGEILAANQRSETELSSLDPLLSAACCQQNRRTNSASTQGPDEPQNHNLRHESLMSNNYLQQHQTTPSFSSLATLNTPTIISPSQLRSGNICFLPSPTLSPMSSVFDLPSPLLVFPHSTQQTQPNLNSCTNRTIGAVSPNATSKSKSQSPANNQQSTSIESVGLDKPTNDTQVDAEPISNAQQSKNNPTPAYSEADLSHLITPAQRKVTTARSVGNDPVDKVEDNHRVGGLDIDDVNMEVVNNDVDLNVENSTPDIPDRADSNETRPATSIPEIYVTRSKFQEPTGPLNRQKCSSAQNENNWQKERSSLASINQRQIKDPDSANTSSQVSHAGQLINTSSNHRHQRDAVDKRALSPNSFRSRINIYHNERHGSSSAPPDVNQLKARSKVKTIEAWSYNELASVKNKESHYKTCAPLTDQNHRLLHQDQMNAGAASQHFDGSNFQYRPSYYEAQNEFDSSWTPTTAAIQSSEVLVKQTGSHTGVSVVKPMIEGRSSSAEPPGSFQPKHSRSSLYNVVLETTTNQLPRDHRNLSHSAQQLQQDYSTPQTRPWCAMASGPDNLQQHHGQQTHFVGANQQLMQQQHSVSVNHHTHQLNSISDTGSDMNCSRTKQQQLREQQQQLVDEIPLYKTAGEGAISSGRGGGYMQNCQPRLQSSYPRTSIDHLDDLVINSQQTGLIAPSRTNPTGNKPHNVPFSYIGDTAFTNCIPRPMETNLFCSNSWANNGNNTTFITNVVNFNNQNYGRNVNQLNSLKSAQSNTALASARSCSTPCNIEAENQSDPSEGNSMDFCPLSGPGSIASRSSSAASSNMAARKYHCDQCSKSFTRSDMLTRHRRLHSGDRPFQCGECKQEFSRSDHLSTHMRTHTGEKPYRCKLCSYSACRKDMITRHMKVHNRSQTSIDTMDSM